MSGIDEILRHNLQAQGQKSYATKGNSRTRNVYPAEVLFIDDPLNQGRLKARIEGRDKNFSDTADLPWCVPMETTFLYSKPRIGEMVFLVLEAPEENQGIRYWTGPIHRQQHQHQVEVYSSAKNIFRNTTSNSKAQISSSDIGKLDIPKGFDVGLEGRDDAWLILKPKEVRLVAGAFKKGTLQPNTETPSHISISQQENTDQNLRLKAYSRTNITSTVINLYSHLGKFRDSNIAKFEINDNLESMGELAQSLSPSVKGDELIKLLDLIIRFCLTHIHTPQSPAAPTALSAQLSRYTVEGELQKTISSYVRIN